MDQTRSSTSSIHGETSTSEFTPLTSRLTCRYGLLGLPDTTTSASSPASGSNARNDATFGRRYHIFHKIITQSIVFRRFLSGTHPDALRAKQLLHRPPAVMSPELISRLQRVETLEAPALAQERGASTEELEKLKLLCLFCYEALLPEAGCKADLERHGHVVDEAKADDMKRKR